MTPYSRILVALLGWIPLTLCVFAVFPARRAMVIGAVAGWLLLPPATIDVQGLPPLGKASAITAGILLGTVIFDPSRLLAFRPRWFDLPMLVFCLCPYASSIFNGLGPYDGLSAVFRQMVAWLFPYLIGRLYLTDAASFRELAMGMIISGFCLVPFCFLEMRISAQLQAMVYGRLRHHFEGMRFGIYRPQVFFQDGLELGLWINAVVLIAWWLWRAGVFRSLWGLPAGGVVLPVLFITSVACRATGATLLLFLSFLTLWWSTRFQKKWMVWALLAIAPTYYYVRIKNLTPDSSHKSRNHWLDQSALIEMIRTYFNAERARSLAARLWEDDVLMARALKQPVFGWGGYNRSRIIEDPFGDPNNPTILPMADALWTIVLGINGFAGLATMTMAMTLPVALFLVRFPVRRWNDPDLAAVSGLALILALFLLDGLLNAMLNAVYLIIAGGVSNMVPAGAGRVRLPVARRVGGREISQREWPRSPSPIRGGVIDAGSGLSPGSGEDVTARYRALGRTAKERGRPAEAAAAWQHALDRLTEGTAAEPDRPDLRRRWCDCANDLAWLLAGAVDPAVRAPARAVALATRATEAEPECSTYWNTLGAAQYRAGNFEAAVAALDRATALSGGGTAFDHVLLAMAHARLGEPERARHWLEEATRGIDRDRPGHAEFSDLCAEAEALLPAAASAPTAVP